MTMTTYENRIKGRLSAHYVVDGVWGEAVSITNNMVLYSGADLLARALSGDKNAFLTTMYMEYTNEATPTADEPVRERTSVYYEALSDPKGYCRVPLTAAPGFRTSSSEYEGNILILKAQTEGTTENGPGLVDGVSNVVAAALAAAPSVSDKTLDRLFSSAVLKNGSSQLAPLPKIANAQIGIRWELKFL